MLRVEGEAGARRQVDLLARTGCAISARIASPGVFGATRYICYQRRSKREIVDIKVSFEFQPSAHAPSCTHSPVHRIDLRPSNLLLSSLIELGPGCG